jgi:membrane-bound serine protease (ClpP class)
VRRTCGEGIDGPPLLSRPMVLLPPSGHGRRVILAPSAAGQRLRRGRAALLALLAALLLVPVVLVTTGDAHAQPAAQGGAQAEQRRVEILPLRGGFLDPPVAAQFLDVLELAEREGAELVVLQLNARGGVSVDTAELAARIAESPIPVAVYVGPIGTGPVAAGAAAAVFLAAHVRALAPDAAVGALEPLDLRALDAGVPSPLELLAATPRTPGTPGARDATPSDELRATLDALVLGEVDADALAAVGLGRITTGVEPLLVELDGTTVATAAGDVVLRLRPDEVQVRFHSLGLLRRLLHAATTAPFVYLLLVLGLGMLLFEVFQPGFGVAGLAGVITAVVGLVGAFILPVRWWAVALVVLGLLLYAVDAAVAGFGPVTALATASFAAGSWWFYAAPALQLSWWLVALTTITAFIFFVLVLTMVLRAQAGPEGTDVADLVGRVGVVRSMLNPEGHVFLDDALWRARFSGEGGAKVGTTVRVHAVDGPVILVEAHTAEQAD